LASFISSATASAQTATILGQVTDQSGAVLPGVTVTATSPALQVPELSVVTNEEGEYRLAPLPIGVYQLAFDLAGFRPAQRQDVRLGVGFTAKIDMQMGLATVAESVTVSAASPVVDVSSTAPSTLLTKEFLELTPTTRNGTMSLLTLAPGVRSYLDIGGSQLAENSQTRAFGQGGQVWFTLDGISTTNLTEGGGSGSFWDSQTIEEARVQSLGTDAEAPTRGVQVYAIVKSGGNDFHGSGFFAGTQGNLQADNLDDDLRAEGFTVGSTVDHQYDVSGDLGGRIIRNKLWFYGAARRRLQELTIFGALKADGTPANDQVTQNYFTQKFSYQATASNRFIVFNMYQKGRESNKQDDLRSYESREDKDNKHPVSKIEWEGVRGSSLIASVLYGRLRQDSTARFLGGPVGREDLETGVVTGENVVNGERSRHTVNHTKGTVTFFKPNWGAGNHEFKGGAEYFTNFNSRSLQPKPFNYHLLYNNGVPDQIALFNAPVYPEQNVNYMGTYLRDNWTVGRRLTLSLGLRYSRQTANVPEQCRDAASAPSNIMFPAQCFDEVDLATWNGVAPRLRAALDVAGDGKTVIKGGWGRYDHMRNVTPDALRMNRNSIAYGIFNWRDTNGNNDYDTGEVNLDPTGPDFIRTTGMEFEAIAPTFQVNPDEKQPKVDEYSLSFEHELVQNFAVRVTGLYVQQKNVIRIENLLRPFSAYNVPITSTDPGPDGELGTSDDGGAFTYYEFPESLAGAQNERYFTITDPNVNQTFKSIELSGSKRLANRWQMMASYSATKKDVPVTTGLAPRDFGDGFRTIHEVGFYTPNDNINRADRTWEWDAKFSGSYLLPADVLVSANFHHISGDVYARTVQFRDGVTIPSIRLNVEPIGSIRSPNINNLTFRVEKDFRLRTAQKLAVRLDIYNALNANTATRIQPNSGETFLGTRDIMFPRLAEISASYTF